MPAYKLTRAQDWQQVRSPDWQRGTDSGTILSVMVADYYDGPTWPRSAPDLSAISYPSGIAPGYYCWRQNGINPSSGPNDYTNVFALSGGKITSPFMSGTYICYTDPANPRAWSFGAPSALRPNGLQSICFSQKTKLSCPLSGVLTYYYTQTWPTINTTDYSGMFPTDDELLAVAPDRAYLVTIAPGSSLELIAPTADDSIQGSSLCVFWPGMVLSDFQEPETPDDTYDDGLSTDDLPLSTA